MPTGSPSKNGRLKWLVFLVLMTVSACATGPKFVAMPEPSRDEALIYLYRPWNFVHGAGSPTVHINNDHIVDLTNGGYTQISVPAGDILIRIKKPATIFQVDWSSSVLVEAKAGETYYVRWVPRIVDSAVLPTGGGYIRTKGDMRIVSEALGRSEIVKTSFVALEPAKE